MNVHVLDARVAIRVFQVTYWPDLDGPEGSEIKLGVFGDLRLGERYALGLIARTKTEPGEAERVGRLAKHLVENPYKALRERYEDIWGAPSPPDAFERTRLRTHSSLVFSEPKEIAHQPVSVADFQENADSARTWCMDELRPILRDHFTQWMANAGVSKINEREQFAELDGNEPEPAQRAGGLP